MSTLTYSTVRIRTLGVIFIAMLLAGVWLVSAVFNQKFTDYDKVTLKTDASGLQLPDRADVKIRGVIIGQVTKMDAEPNGGGATLTLGIYPDKMGAIPKNVTAAIFPKTLFGEKYVELNIPESPSPQHLVAGDKIGPTQLPIELEKVLNDIYPLLTAIQPDQLNYTLSALANALDGRGEKLGNTLTTLDDYLTKFNPQVPSLVEDLKNLATVSDTYADVTPQLAQTLRNTVKTGNTFVSQKAALTELLRQTSSFSDTAKSFLDANGQNITELAKVSAPQLAVLNEYSSEFPCLFEGLAGQVPLLASAFRGYMLHINLITLPAQPRGYGTIDKPVYGAKNPATCAGLPNPKGTPTNPFQAPNVKDGVDDNGGSLGRGDSQRVAPGWATQGSDEGFSNLLVGAATGGGN